jgi:multiple sugar transport system substrate-binding protein
MRKQHLVLPALAVTSALALAGCSGGGGGGGGGGEGDASLTIWTIEDVVDRVNAQEEMAAQFTEETGIDVEITAVAEGDLNTVLASSAASGELPDAIAAVPLTSLYQFSVDDLVDTDAAAAVVDALGEDTFTPRALELTRQEGAQLGVPSDGWAQLLFYRSDLFEKAGLEAPATFDDILAAAEALDSPDLAGITVATAPADPFTQQTFEHFALANGCELVDDAGEVTLDSPECTATFEFFSELAGEFSLEGNQDVDTTRASYFAGEAAMIIWSSFLLDELAGLRNDALPTCDECDENPAFLAENSGIVSAIQGPDGSEPASFGEIVSFAIMADAAPEAQDFVQWMMDGQPYLDWLGIAPEGKVPVRMGTADNPTEFADAWTELEAGVDTLEVLSAIYPPEALTAVAEAPGSFDRWGIPQGQGQLAGVVAGQLIVPQAISDMLNADLSPDDAAARAAEEAQSVKDDQGL